MDYKDLEYPENAVFIAAAILLVIGLVLVYTTQTAEASPLQENVSALQEQVIELETTVACQTAAKELNTGYCSMYVRGGQGTDDPTVERCGNTRDMQSSQYANTAAEMGCGWTEQVEDAGTVTVNGETVDCVEEGYISPECPA